MKSRTLLISAVLGLIILSFSIPAVSAYGPKKIQVSQTTVNHYLSRLKTYAGPVFSWPKGSNLTFTCSTQGCAISFNEKATNAIQNMMALGVGVTGVVTAILALSGVGLPAAAVVGLVVAMFTVGGAWIAFADSWGGGNGVYAAWYLGSLLFYIWCNPVPSQFLPTVTSTTTTDPITTSTQSSVSTESSSSIQSSTTVTSTSSCYTDPVNPKVCLYAPQ